MNTSSAIANLSLGGKAALVTGGARRLGRGIALCLARAGASVAITYSRSEVEANLTLRELEAVGVSARALECEVRSEASVQAAVAAAVEAFGRLDLLVNNAGVFASTPLDQITMDEWDAMFATNTRGPFLMARAALPHLNAAGGRIVNLGSLGGIRPWAGHAHYCSSKAALHMLTATMAKAFAPQVSVNCVAPGWIEFEGETSEQAAHFAEKTPMRRNGSAEDVAAAVLFFAAGPAFITGQILTVDGGLGLT